MPRSSPLLPILWIVIAAAVYLWPFRLHFAPVFHTNDAEWTSDGIAFANNGMLRTATPPTALHERLVGGHGLTVEAWLTSATPDQSGPARIVTYSAGADERNFTLGAEDTSLVFRLRTSPADPNGIADQITVPGVFVVDRPQHVTVVYDLASLHVYVDGQPRAHFTGHEGTLDAWSAAHSLAIGNELTGDRPWRGTIRAVVVADAPRSAAEILADFRQGLAAAGANATAAYDLTQGPAAMNGIGALPTRLERPVAYINGVYPELLTRKSRSLEDFAFNFTVFAVMGWLASTAAGRRRRVGFRTVLVLAPLVVAAAVTLESLQIYVDGRTSSLRDLTAAIGGGLTGILASAGWLSPRKPC